MLVHASPAEDHHSVCLLDLGRVFKINHGDHDRKADQNGLILLIDVKLEHLIVLPVVNYLAISPSQNFTNSSRSKGSFREKKSCRSYGFCPNERGVVGPYKIFLSPFHKCNFGQ